MNDADELSYGGRKCRRAKSVNYLEKQIGDERAYSDELHKSGSADYW